MQTAARISNAIIDFNQSISTYDFVSNQAENLFAAQNFKLSVEQGVTFGKFYGSCPVPISVFLFSIFLEIMGLGKEKLAALGPISGPVSLPGVEHKPRYFDNKNINENFPGDLKINVRWWWYLLKDKKATVSCHVALI